MTEMINDGPPSPMETALKEQRPITKEIEQQTFGPAYQYMRAKGLTPLGVRDSAQRLLQWYSEGAITEERAEMLPTVEQAQTVVDSIDAGRYTEALGILEERDTVLEDLIGQKEEAAEKKIAAYKEQHPEIVAEYKKLIEQKRQFARAGALATEAITEKVRNHPFRRFREETSKRLDSLRQHKAEYSGYIRALKGQTAD